MLCYNTTRQESRAVARKPRDAAAVLFGLKFADDIHYKFEWPSFEARLQSSKHTGTKQNLTHVVGELVLSQYKTSYKFIV